MDKFNKICEDVMDDFTVIQVAAEREMKYDSSGGYSIINTKDGKLRLDWMSTNDEPIFAMVANTPAALYKRLVDEFQSRHIVVSTEHAMYIGKELQRASTEGTAFVQEQLIR
jgi:hypothetical protein